MLDVVVVLFRISEATESFDHGFRLVHAECAELVDAHGDVHPHLLVEITENTRAIPRKSEKSMHTRRELHPGLASRREERHGRQAVSRMSETAST